jgi:hypothetical protein
VYEETNRSYPFANGLNGLAHLWYRYVAVGKGENLSLPDIVEEGEVLVFLYKSWLG